MLLSLAGGAIGILLSTWFSAELLRMASVSQHDVALAPADWKALVFVVLIAGITTSISCIPVGAQIRTITIAEALGGDAGVGVGMPRRTLRLRKLLVGAQVSFCMALIAAGVLLMRSLGNMQESRVGGAPESTLFTRIAPSQEIQSPGTGRLAYLRVISVLQAMPQVQSASLISHVPIGGGSKAMTVSLVNAAGDEDADFVDALNVGPGFFQTMGLSLLGGRDFNLGDREGKPTVAAINEALASRFWATTGNALGQEILIPGTESPIRIVAIVENTKRMSLAEDVRPQLYLPFLQHYQPGMVIVVRTRREAAPLAPLVRREIESAAPGIRFLDSLTLREHLDRRLRPVRIASSSFLIFGGIILGLSLGGLYSIVASFVSLRRREIGLRLAIGGSRSQAVQSILREGFGVSILSGAIGVGLALTAGNLLEHMLYGVKPLDPSTLAFSLVLTLLATGAACVGPAMTAVRISPAELLRSS